jgi:hypothetical protein
MLDHNPGRPRRSLGSWPEPRESGTDQDITVATGAEAMALWRVAVRAAPHNMRALKMAANVAAVAASLRTFMTCSLGFATRHMIHHARNQGARLTFPPQPHSPVDNYVPDSPHRRGWLGNLTADRRSARHRTWNKWALERIARARPVSLAGAGRAKCEVAAVHRLYHPHFLKRFGPVLRVAMEDMVKEEMPQEIGDLLSRLRQLEPSARRQARRDPAQR